MMIRPLTDRKWRGYSFNELQDRRILNEARIHIQKAVIRNQFKHFSLSENLRGASKKIFGALGYTDYIMLAVSIFRRMLPIFRFFRRKKK